ncbi:hypothetical protein [Paenibacillus sp. OV219]|uniref:hypothetical protein n=1 Tax=Paenibacillus sp. OV219 TaxID=1884377 RepID=UPI0008B129F3|nr:hypothetical protein [Paenibacillus sp. OV219]SEO93180.1 hypothetical protein SAMN05518847_11310 [Paenibacillus sp. OV219]
MPFTTGVVTNTRDFGTAAAYIVVNIRNLDITNAATIEVQIFASVDSSLFYTLDLVAYVVPANSYNVREFFIEGNVAYEVQILATGTLLTPNVVMSVYGINEFGNMVTEQRFAQTELSFIPSLSPSM